MFGRNEDIFTSNVGFENDVVFTEIKEISKYFIGTLLKNFEIVKKISERQNFEEGNRAIFQDAGNFYNLTLILKSIDLIDDNELLEIANSFKQIIAGTKYKTISHKIIDPLKHLMYFTKYFYVPVRLSYTTIPDYMQLVFLKTWITTLCIFVLKSDYTNKYANVYKNYDIYLKCLSTLRSNEQIRGNLVNTPMSSYINILSTIPAQANGLHNFVHVFSKLVAHMNIEIINKFCPNFNACQTVNVKYNGVWLSPLDQDISLQISKLKSIIS